MSAQYRSSIILCIVAVLLLAARWPLEEYVCNTETWRSTTQRDTFGRPVIWRPPAGEGENFFSAIFRGGSGTPAVLAMFGGQRYMIANIMWTYSDVLFHNGKPFEMVYPLESTVTLNPAFYDAWSVYGWHLAWNLNSYVSDMVMKAKFVRDGESVYKRAILANPENPLPYFDLCWLYLQRVGNYEKARIPMEFVIYGKYPDGSLRFTPLSKKERDQLIKTDIPLMDKRWDAQKYGHRLAYVYKKLGIVTADQAYFEKAIDVYQLCLKADPKDDVAEVNMQELQTKRLDPAWLKEQQEQETLYRRNFQMRPIKEFGLPADQLFETESGSDFEQLTR